jgi:hypothetical protein
MKTLIHMVALIAVLAVLGSVLSRTAMVRAAQWPPHTTPGIPRLPDGAPNLTAPTPRTSDGKTDFSGLWQNRGVAGRDARPPEPPPGTPPLAMFWNVGAGFKDDLPFQPWAAELRKKRMAEDSKDNPDAHCLPMGFMQFHTHPQPRQIVQTPTLMVIIYEANYGLRKIYLDGRPAPVNDPQPWWYGYSRGWWEGATLVVETTNFREDGWLDVNGSPLTDAAKVTERFRRVNFGQLEIDVTVDDPKAYTRPWTVRLNQYLMVDSELIEFICHENQQFLQRRGNRP